MELRTKDALLAEAPKPTEIPVPREISQLIGMGFKHQNSKAISEIAKDIKRLRANPAFNERAIRMQVYLEQITDFVENLEGKEVRLLEITPGVYDSKFVGEKETLSLKPGKQILDDPAVPKLILSILDAIMNPLQVLSARADQIPQGNEDAIRTKILGNCGQIKNRLDSFRNAEKVDVTVDKNIQVNLVPINKSSVWAGHT